MSDIVISVENLSKYYNLGTIGTGTLSHDLNRWWAQLRGKPDPMLKIGQEPVVSRQSPVNSQQSTVSSEQRKAHRWFERFHPSSFILHPSEYPSDAIWALRDVSFEVKQGEVLGIIGRNGAGKSTLLKILSRVTAPTSGEVKVKGRIASLLEVGTGFHPELTGRENIYLNGAILGMQKREIRRNFDEIVAFAEVEKFIDTPVKRYSSGMYVRLAFAVAAHLEPEILLVDEVLAVGDAAFQKKCLGKMGDVAKQGRTVLFVSHSIPMILRLCERSILLNNGNLVIDGHSSDVTKFYLSSPTTSPAERIWRNIQIAPGDIVARLKSVRVVDEQGNLRETVDIRTPILIEVEYWNLQSKLRPTVILHVINEEGITLFASNDFSNLEWRNTPRSQGLVKATCRLPGNFMAEGRFFLLIAIGSYNPNQLHVFERDIVSFQIVDPSQGDGVRGEYAGGHWPGLLRPMLKWSIEVEPTLDVRVN